LGREDQTSVTALYLLRLAVDEALSDEVSGTRRSLVLYAYNPFKGANKRKADGRVAAWRKVVALSLRAADGDRDLRDSLYVATFYRAWETARVLARKASQTDNAGQDTLFLAVHTFVARGEGAEDQAAAFRLLDSAGVKRLKSWFGERPPRLDLQIREIALQALLRMTGTEAAALTDVETAFTRCPFAKRVQMVFVKDQDSWPDVIRYWQQTLDLKQNGDPSNDE